MNYAERIMARVKPENMDVMWRVGVRVIAAAAEAEIAALRDENERLRRNEAAMYKLLQQCEAECAALRADEGGKG